MDNPVAPGDVFLDKYRVERVLGKGGMGIVIAARHVDLGQLYAIKFLLPSMLDHPESMERFLREARAAARLQSDHVARVHDVGRMENGAPYMVMEHLDGCDLKVWLKQQGPLPWTEAVEHMLQVCDAIAEAHEAGIVHRDLKPANLFLVHRRNGNSCVKVLDFGISKSMGSEELDLTQTNAILGSPMYMSPEQMARTKTVDSRTDIWALGVILYELLAGVSPFKSATMTEVVSRVLQEEPVPLSEVRSDLPPGVDAVIARCLRKRREERFQTIAELVDALVPFVSERPVRAPSVSMRSSEVVANFAPPASTLAHSVPDPASVTSNLTTSAWEKTRGIGPQRGRMRRVWTAVAALGTVLVAGAVWFGTRRPAEVPEAAVSGASSIQGAFLPATPPIEPAPALQKEAPSAPVASAAQKATTPKPRSTSSLKATPPPVRVASPPKPVLPPPPPSPTGTAKKRRGVL